MKLLLAFWLTISTLFCAEYVTSFSYHPHEHHGHHHKSNHYFDLYAQLPLQINVSGNSEFIPNLELVAEEYNTYGNMMDVVISEDIGWLNGKFDFHGLMSYETFLETFGAKETDVPRSAIGIAVRRHDPETLELLETDIALISTFNFVDDDEVIYASSDSNTFGKNLTIAHEIGHCFGLPDYFYAFSIMNYHQHQFDYSWRLKSYDLRLLRRRYDSMYTVNDSSVHLIELVARQAFRSYVKRTRDGKIVIDDLKVEHLDDEEKELTIEWFLNTEFMTEDNSISLGTTTSTTNIVIDVPDTLMKDYYFLYAKILDYDDNPHNNFGWDPYRFALGKVENEELDQSKLTEREIDGDNYFEPLENALSTDWELDLDVGASEPLEQATTAKAVSSGGGGGGCLIK